MCGCRLLRNCDGLTELDLRAAFLLAFSLIKLDILWGLRLILAVIDPLLAVPAVEDINCFWSFYLTYLFLAE